ncbi:hypothetical protein [Streptomyces sp. NPDC017940]|uniref:hypothetical protein n=1 Tax=Streptomyces sp. NPDC017940 TaxID=3365017 RepID=UPI0037A52388
MPPSLIGRLRSAQHYTQLQEDGYHNMSELVRAAVEERVSYLEKTYNNGKPFPAVDRLRTGPSPAGAVRGARVRARKRRDADETVQPRLRTRQAGAGEEQGEQEDA